MDDGIATKENLKMITDKQFDYVSISRSSLKKYTVVEDAATVTVYDRRKRPIEPVEVKTPDATDSEYYLIVTSPVKTLKDASMYKLFCTRYEEGLMLIIKSIISKGGIKKYDKVNQRIGRLVQKYPSVHKLYDTYLVADSFFAKSEVVQTVTSLGMHFLSRLRDDAVLFYLNRKEVAQKLYFSTDLKMDGIKIVSYYRSRFQIEFLYRDAKQHCGLEDWQARSKYKLNFHFNAALTTVNIAKLHRLDTRKSNAQAFSMADFKTLCHNKLLLDRFISVFAINPNSAKNQQKDSIFTVLLFYNFLYLSCAK